MLALLTSSKLRSANGRAADLRPLLPAPVGIALDVGDPDLRAALARLIGERPEMQMVEDGDAKVVVRDGADTGVAEFDTGRRVLRIGGNRAPGADETVIESIEPAIILAAALLLGRGYRLAPPDRPSRGSHPQLSARERQVMTLLIEGGSNKEIARRLDISVHTAKFHVTAVMEKLGARNRADAVAIALREGQVVL